MNRYILGPMQRPNRIVREVYPEIEPENVDGSQTGGKLTVLITTYVNRTSSYYAINNENHTGFYRFLESLS